jgi:hypothetical protein
MAEPTQAQINFGTPTDEIERAAHDWLTKNICLEGESVMHSLADLIRSFALKRLMQTPAPWDGPTKAQIEAARKMLQLSTCFGGDVCTLMPCACAETMAALTAQAGIPKYGAWGDIAAAAQMGEDEDKLAALYVEFPSCVATMCDRYLDESGALLGRIRTKGNAIRALKDKQ